MCRYRDGIAKLGAASAVAAIALLLVGCDDGASTSDGPVAPPVWVEPVRGIDLVERIEATGELQARNEATIASQVAGQVTALHVEEGDAVDAGAILLAIDPEKRELEVNTEVALEAEARAAVTEARREMDRVVKLSARNAASDQQVDESKTRLELAEARLRGARARVGLARRARSDATVVAPFAGLVGERKVSEGEFLSVGQPLFELVDLDPIEVAFRLAEVDSGRVQLGHAVRVRVAPYPDEMFPAEVTAIAPTIDRRTRTLRVKATLSNDESRLRPGTFAHVDLGVAERVDVPMIPEESVLQRADGSVVFRLVGADRVERLRVQTGMHRDGLVEVGAPLAIGDRVVVRGQVGLIDGSLVSLRDRDGRPLAGEANAEPVP